MGKGLMHVMFGRIRRVSLRSAGSLLRREVVRHDYEEIGGNKPQLFPRRPPLTISLPRVAVLGVHVPACCALGGGLWARLASFPYLDSLKLPRMPRQQLSRLVLGGRWGIVSTAEAAG